MSPRLDGTELAQRFRGQSAELIVQMASLLQGGILSGAAFSLIGIFQTQDDTLIRLMLWLTSVIIGLVMFFRLCQRALFLMHAGVEVVLMLPITCLFEIITFAILSSTALGPHGWRYWYVADTLVFAAGLLATWLSLLALKPEQYAKDTTVVFTALRATTRNQCFEGAAATLFTAFLTVWLLCMPPTWSFATAFVSVHLGLTIISSVLIVRQDARLTTELRNSLAF